MTLSNPDARRGLRSAIRALSDLVALAMLAYILWNAPDKETTAMIATGCLILIGMSVAGYIVENGIRSAKIELPGGVSAEVTGGDE